MPLITKAKKFSRWQEWPNEFIDEIMQSFRGVNCVDSSNHPELRAEYGAFYCEFSELLMHRPVLQLQLDPTTVIVSTDGGAFPVAFFNAVVAWPPAGFGGPALPAPVRTVVAANVPAGASAAPAGGFGYVWTFADRFVAGFFAGYLAQSVPGLRILWVTHSGPCNVY
jgi:hypothetical protein